MWPAIDCWDSCYDTRSRGEAKVFESLELVHCFME